MRFARLCALAAGCLALVAISPVQAAMASAQPAGYYAGEYTSGSLPYTDPGQTGLLTLCSQSGQPMTHGYLTTKPFAWKIVSSVPAPAGYHVKGGTAQVFAYQPRQYTPAGAWSGVVLTGASVYSNIAHPMVQETPIDEPLTFMTDDFPPLWDGLIELRMYLGGPGESEYENTYGAADLRVSGNTWTLVQGGLDYCGSGTSVSRETILHLPGSGGTPKPTSPPAANAAGQSPSTGSGSGAGAGSSSTTSPGLASAGQQGVSGTLAADNSSSVPAGAIAGIAAAIVVLGGCAEILRRERRRRRRAG
jgi:hypothetical protein